MDGPKVLNRNAPIVRANGWGVRLGVGAGVSLAVTAGLLYSGFYPGADLTAVNVLMIGLVPFYTWWRFGFAKWGIQLLIFGPLTTIANIILSPVLY